MADSAGGGTSIAMQISSKEILRRTREQPLRTTALLWGLLLLMWVPIGFCGYANQSWVDRPPAFQAVPYASFLPGGALAHEVTFQLDPDDVPTFDRNLIGTSAISFFGQNDALTGEGRLIWDAQTREGAFGWPWSLVEWRSITRWDVSDPTRPFAEHAGDWKSYALWQFHSISFGHANVDGTRIIGAQVFWPVISLELLATLIGAAAMVAPVTMWHRLLYRRRARDGCCLNCGYKLHSGTSHEKCPECGTTVTVACNK